MIDVFISYGSEDRLKANALANLFTELGWDVWWDKKLKGGVEWSPEIINTLKNSKSVVVLWSRDSIKKDWVIKEAKAAEVAGTLIPVLLQPSVLETPTPDIQAIKLSTWLGKRTKDLEPLIKAIAEKTNKNLDLSLDEYDDVLKSSLKDISRVEVAQVVFDYCAVALRHEILRLNGHRFNQDELDEKVIAYDNLSECLSPEGGIVSREDLHESIPLS